MNRLACSLILAVVLIVAPAARACAETITVDSTPAITVDPNPPGNMTLIDSPVPYLPDAHLYPVKRSTGYFTYQIISHSLSDGTNVFAAQRTDATSQPLTDYYQWAYGDSYLRVDFIKDYHLADLGGYADPPNEPNGAQYGTFSPVSFVDVEFRSNCCLGDVGLVIAYDALHREVDRASVYLSLTGQTGIATVSSPNHNWPTIAYVEIYSGAVGQNLLITKIRYGIPEPAALVMFFLGSAALFAFGRRIRGGLRK